MEITTDQKSYEKYQATYHHHQQQQKPQHHHLKGKLVSQICTNCFLTSVLAYFSHSKVELNALDKCWERRKENFQKLEVVREMKFK